MKKILVPTDFSEQAGWALEAAVDVAKRTQAQIVLIHVIEEPTPQSFNVEGEMELSEDWEERIYTLKMIERDKRELRKLAVAVLEQGVSVVSELRLGNPYHGVNECIVKYAVDLIVMGTTGKSRFQKVLLGSNTERVVRHSKVPVLTIHNRVPKDDFRNIVYATSMNPGEQVFANVIKTAQEIYNSTVHLVYINTRTNFSSDLAIRGRMKKFVEDIELDKYTLNIFNDFTEEQGILNFAESIGADLIGMATHEAHGFLKVLTGSISHDVVDHSSKPVLTYVTPDF